MFIYCVVKLALMRAQLKEYWLSAKMIWLVFFGNSFAKIIGYVCFFVSGRRQTFIIINVITVHK